MFLLALEETLRRSLVLRSSKPNKHTTSPGHVAANRDEELDVNEEPPIAWLGAPQANGGFKQVWSSKVHPTTH